ncbi:MAG TPA: pyridoxamine 5'-phosphate oxidase [Candidatus Binataceae bacterium]|nr:pyridoxamine 5'-phosphate oxidase [Candidatus Binataceae bacterium]
MKAEDPIARFTRWFRQEVAAGTNLPEVMALATCGSDGIPSVRYVLLKQADGRGFSFYTDIRSPKGQQLAQNPRAALAFYWPRRGRQVRIDGSVERMSAHEADAYWVTRPLASRISASASYQSHRLKNREELIARVAKLRQELRGKEPVRPNYWLGLRVVPNRIEFWVRAPFRLHRRELFLRSAGRWRKTLLQP